MRIRKRVVFILCVFVLISNIAPSRSLANNEGMDVILKDCKEMAETDQLVLYYAPETHGIFVKDKSNGFIWGSAVTEAEYNISSLNELLKSKLSSLFDFRYVSSVDRTSTLVSINYIENKPEVTIQPIKNGMEMLFDFEKLGLSIPIEISVEENILTLNIPAEKIEEKREYQIVELELMPFFGAASNQDEGYMFYPDGCGALFYFKDMPHKDTSKISYYIYGTDRMDFTKYKEIEDKDIKTAMLPIFGVKKDDNAFIGIVTDGDFDAAINFVPSGFENIYLHRLCPDFTYRRSYRDIRNDPKIPPRIEGEMVKSDRKVQYHFLSGKNADYSGMAGVYRNYLLEKGELVKKIGQNETNIPMGLDIFMGIKERRLLRDKYISVTTFDQTKEILDEFGQNGVNNIQLNLIGWTNKGYGIYPSYLPPNSKIGGNRGLRHLTRYTKEKGIPIYLESNFTDADKEAGGFSIRNDVVYQRNNLVLTNMSKERFLLNPTFASQMAINKFIPKVAKYGVDGISFDQIGSRLYQDYNKKEPATREDTAKYWNTMLDNSATQLGKAAVYGGNAYTLKYVDRLFDIPVEDSADFLTHETIPFYQMVVHGSIPYSSTPGNLFYDYERQKLKWIEYGCMPYFKLTYSRSEILKNTDYNHLFTSYYKDWINSAIEVYDEFNENLGTVWSKRMTDHKKIYDNVYKVSYEDGIVIYVNYNDIDVYVDGYEIKAVDYLIINEGSKKR